MRTIHVLVLSLALMLGVGVPVADAASYHLRLLLAGISGTYYIQGSGLAEFINRHSEILRLTPGSSGGSTENIRKVSSGQGDLGLAFASDIYEAWEGQGEFTGEVLRGYRVVGPAQEINGWQFIVRSDSGVETVDQLKGKRFVIGQPGSGAFVGGMLFITEAGLKDQMTALALPYAEVANLMADGDIIGFNRTGEVPLPFAVELDVIMSVRAVDLGPEMDRIGFLEKYPYFHNFVIPAGSYSGQTREARTFGQDVWWIAHENVPEEAVYEFVRLSYTPEAIAHLDTVYPGHAHRRENPLEGVLRPLHPGAARYWRERGFDVPEF